MRLLGPWPGRVRLVLGGQAVSLFGDGLAVVAVPLLALGLTDSAIVTGLATASATIGSLIVAIPAGLIVDRVDPWRVLIVADVLRTLVFGALFGLAVAGLLTAAWLVTFIVAAGAAQAGFETALTVVVRNMVPDKDLVRANAVVEFAAQSAFVLGPGTAAVLTAAGGLHVVLLANTLTFLVSLATLVSAREIIGVARSTARSTWSHAIADLKQAARYLLSIRPLVLLTALQMVVNFGLAVERLLVFYASHSLHSSPAQIGLVVSGGGLGGMLGVVTAIGSARRFGSITTVAGGVVAAAIATIAMSFANSFHMLWIANVMFVWAVVLASVVNRALRQELTRPDMLGRTTGLARLLFRSVDPLGVVVLGALTTAAGGDARPAFMAGGVLALLAVSGAWFAGLREFGSPRGGPGRR
ncbi:MFS transporter [Nocardia sp. NPDC057668]|uniref:MFS transporter n=1 Tax=Nocardia sp. NPDC057668 TaxID=3346202 RepID=UPI003671B680